MTFFHSANYFGHGGVNASITSSSITNVSQEFADIISNSQYTDYSSYKYLIGVNDPPIDFKVTNAAKYLPNEIETIAHLKLIRAFSVMKRELLAQLIPTMLLIYGEFCYQSCSSLHCVCYCN